MDLYSENIVEDGSDIDDDDWEEMDELDQKLDCLFCPSVFGSHTLALSHCIQCHKIDFRNLKTRFNMDCYSFIKLVNFIRETSASPEHLISVKSALWNDDKYLKPVKEYDPWLMFDFEEHYDQTEDNLIPEKISNGHSGEQDLVSELQAELSRKEEEISELKNQISLMKNCVQNIVEDDSCGEKSGSVKISHSVDTSYFESYCNPGIHHEMLTDSVRTLAYKNAILENETIFAGKIVLDLGCGTGMLSLFAASVPSEKVHAIDNSDIAYFACEIIRENGLESKINIIKGRIEDDHSELEKVDIIVSEWMGYFLLFEGMLDSLIHARDTYLKPNGVLLPDSCSLFICGAHDQEGFDDKIKFWSDVYGYRMSAIQREVIKEAIIDAMPSEKIVTSKACIASFDLYTCSVDDTSFTSSVELVYHEDTSITALVGYFDTAFNLPNPVHFSTGPFTTLTHWKQTLFYLPEQISRKKGETLTVKLTCSRCKTDNRALLVTISVNNHEYAYNVR